MTQRPKNKRTFFFFKNFNEESGFPVHGLEEKLAEESRLEEKLSTSLHIFFPLIFDLFH